MDSIIDKQFSIKAINTPNKVLQTIKKIQFIMEFFVLSKFSQNSEVLPEFLIGIEAFKFYYRIAHFAEQGNIYLENHEEKIQQQQHLSSLPFQKMGQLLDKIKNKCYMSNNFQPEQFQELASGKKMQLVTSVKLPSNLKRCQLNFLPLLGEVISLLRPLISIIGIRLFGLNSYKSYLLSLAIDLLILLILQRNVQVSKKIQIEELEGRKRQFFSRYFFRMPLFSVLRKLIIEPLLKKIIREDRVIYKLILSILQMQSSITLTI